VSPKDALPVAGVLFDLYGTLLGISRREIHRAVPHALGVPRDRWIDVVRKVLLVQPFPDAASFARAVSDALGVSCGADALAACVAAVEREVASVTPFPGARPLLHFLKRRGYKLGVVSNLVSPHVAPLAAFGMADLFDAAVFSCEEGIVKPDPEIYRRAAERLGLPPERILVVGDSARNDVEAPAALGMRTAGVKVPGRDATLTAVSELGLLDLSELPFTRLLEVGHELEVDGRRLRVESIAAVPDDELGRYNLVYVVEASGKDGTKERLYMKRYLLPETAHVEVFAYRLQEACGLPACRAAIVRGQEPLLVVTEAPGAKLERAETPEQAYQVGMHCAFAYLFSNADIRPRNAFWVDGASPRLTLVDLEHCLFNLAIDTTGLAEPERPDTFDTMPTAELAARVKKRVLSPRLASRARRCFYDLPLETEIAQAYRSGFLEFYARQRERSDVLLGLLEGRVHGEPPLVIGTQAYRRAMASVDVEDIRSRLQRDPEEALAATY
jgi:HAD superfamily hydrolase (TIGR01509 family)